MSFQGFGKSSGPSAPPSSSNPFASSFPRNTTPTQPLFAPPLFQPPVRPTEPSPKWGDEYPTLNEVYNTQTNQRASVIPVQTAGSRNLTKSSQVQDQKRNRSLPSLFPDEGTLHNSTTLTGIPRFSSPAWGNKANFPAQFADSMNQNDHLSVPSNFGNYDTGRNSINKERHVQPPKRTRSPVQYDDLDDFTEDPVTVQTESKRLSTRSTDHSDTPVSQFHDPFAPSGPINTEVTTAKLSNFSVPKRSRSPSLLPSDKNSQGDFNVAQDDTERELQAKARRMARFKDELSQPEPSSLGIGNQKVPVRVYDQAVLDNQKSKKESLDMSADNPSANISAEYDGQDSSSIISGLCPEMCPESERAERERKGDLDRYERLDGDRNQSSKYLAVKKYTRTAEREANLIRPMPILQKTMNYLLELLDQPYNDGFLGLYNFLWDRMRAIRMDLRMQHIFNLEAITMLEQMIRLHILAMHELCEYTKGEGFSEGFDAHLNIEQMNKTSVELFQLYDDHRKNGIEVPTEKEFRGYYALLKLDKHPGYKVEPAELSLDLAKMTPEVRQAPDVLFARDVARSCRIGNYIAFFRLVRKARYLQACLMHAHFAKLRTQALASLHSGLQNNQGIPVAHVAQWLGMEDEDIEDLLDYHGFSIKEFEEPYMVKEGPFLNNNDSGTLKCSKLVHLKKSRTMFGDVYSPSLMEPVFSEAVKVISSEKVNEQNHTPVQRSATVNNLVAEEEMDSEPVSSPRVAVPIKPILKDVVINQQNVHDHQPVDLNPLPVNISPALDSLNSMDDRTDDAVLPSFKFEFRSSFEKNNHFEMKTMPMDIMPVVVDQERLPVLRMDLNTDNIVHLPVLVEDLNGADCISTLEDIENTEGSQRYQDEEVATAKLLLILRKWRRHCSLKRELRKKKQIAADTALSSLSLGPSFRHYEEQQSSSGEFNVHLIMKERHDKRERSWSKLNVSEVVAGRLSERNASSKCLCWKVVLCSQIDRSDRSSLSGSAAGSWLYSKIIPAGDHDDEDLITSSTDLSIWKKWINDLTSDEPICCLSIIKDARCDNLEGNVAGANAVMFLVYECIPLRLQKQHLHNLVMALPSGSGVPLLILSGSYKNHSDPSFIANELGLNEVDNSRISCFSVVFLLENHNTVSHDGFFSDILLREGLEWLASRSPKQPVLQSVKTQELVFTHLNPLMKVLDGQSVYTITPTHCISAFNEALKQSVEEVFAAVDANPLGWPCPEVALLEKSSDVYRAVNWYLPRVGWSSAAEVEPLVSALKQCKLPSFSDDMTWLFSGFGMDHDNIEKHKSRLEDCLTRYLTQTSQMMGFSLAKEEAFVMLQKFARLELHESTYYIVPKWALIFRRVFNWRLMNLLNGEISRAYVLKQNDTAAVTNMGVDIIQDEDVVSYHSIIEPSLDEMLQVSCSLRCYPESEASQSVGVMGLNPNKVLTATRGIEVIEEDRSSLQNNSGGDIDNDGSSTLEDIENTEGSQCYQDEEVATAKLILILRKWRRHCSLKRELGKKKQIAADTALSLLSLGPSIRHYEEQQSTSGEFNLHLIMKERQDKHERSWSKVNVSEVVAGILSERNASSKCICWKVVLCSQIDGSDRSSLSGSAAGSWLYSKILPAGDHNDEDLITSSTDLSIWKKWINDLSSDEPICCLSIIKDARCDNLEENVAGANAVMFLVYECIPLRLQKQRLHNLVMALPSGSSVPLLILSGSYKSHSDPSFIANELGLNEVGNSRISCFSVVFLLENQNTVSHDGFFSDIILREGLEWLASRSPKQPVLQSVKTRELVFTHLDPLMEVLNRRSAYTVTPTHCVSAFNEALKQSVEEVVAAVDANPLGWPCPEVALLEKSSDVYRAVNLYLPRVGWSSAAEVEPLASALKQCKLPFFSDDMTWLFSGSGMDHDNIENHKSRLEDCLTRYLTQTSQMMGFSLAKQEAHVMVQKFARPELHESTYYIVLKWALIFRRVFNWRLNRLNGEISRAYVLKQNDTAVVTNMGVDIVQDEGVVFNHSIIEPSLDELLQVSCSLGCYPESEASQPVGVMGLNPNKVLTATRGIEVIEEDGSSLQNNSGGDIDNDGNMNPANSTSKRAVDHVTNEADRLSKLLEKCNAVQNMIDKKLSIYF